MIRVVEANHFRELTDQLPKYRRGKSRSVEPGIRVLKATLAAECDEADGCRRMVWWGCLEQPLGCESPTRYNISRETLPEGDPAGDANSAKPTRTAHAADPGNQAGPRRSPRGTLSWEQHCRTGEVRNAQDSPLRKQLQAADRVNRLTSRGLLEPLASSVSRETIQIQSALLRPLARSGGQTRRWSVPQRPPTDSQNGSAGPFGL